MPEIVRRASPKLQATVGLSPGRRLVRYLAGLVVHGQISVQMPSREIIQHTGTETGPTARIELHHRRAIWRLLIGGDVAFAEAYIDGDWSTPDLVALIELVSLNHKTMMGIVAGSYFAKFINRMRHFQRRNTKGNSKRNIQDHYDLGNSFYESWLDPSMSYSSGFYKDDQTTLQQAQLAKQDMVMDALALTGGEHILEIGCGWGSLARRLAAERGCCVTGITLSQAQLDYASENIVGTCAPGSVDFHLRDYREEEGSYDRIVSIEMLEAVGKSYWPIYFATIHDRLRPGGRAVLQGIVIAEPRYASYDSETDFIQRHIFPGGMLPTVTLLQAHASAAGLVFASVRMFGASYARTLADWRTRFQQAWPQLSRMGFDERFRRKWEYYLSYCEGGFRTAALDVGLFCFERHGAKGG